jgi:hypothetical protein
MSSRLTSAAARMSVERAMDPWASPFRSLALSLVALAGLSGFSDTTRNALPPPPPRFAPQHNALFADDFSDGLKRWTTDRDDVWRTTRGMLRADLPDAKQERSLLYGGSEQWTDYAVDLDVCMVRGVDKGVIVRVQGDQGIAVDLRGPGYQDVILNRREWPLGRATAVNANSTWHHLRVEAQGHDYRVFVNGELRLDRLDGRRSRPRGSIALAAYTGGVGECTVYYDNVVVTPLDPATAAETRH